MSRTRDHSTGAKVRASKTSRVANGRRTFAVNLKGDKMRLWGIVGMWVLATVVTGCGMAGGGGGDGGQLGNDAGNSISDGGTLGSVFHSDGGCALTDNTAATATVHSNGCAVRSRDTSACESNRTGAGISGF